MGVPRRSTSTAVEETVGSEIVGIRRNGMEASSLQVRWARRTRPRQLTGAHGVTPSCRERPRQRDRHRGRPTGVTSARGRDRNRSQNRAFTFHTPPPRACPAPAGPDFVHTATPRVVHCVRRSFLQPVHLMRALAPPGRASACCAAVPVPYIPTGASGRPYVLVTPAINSRREYVICSAAYTIQCNARIDCRACTATCT